jgi:hypothetical protein
VQLFLERLEVGPQAFVIKCRLCEDASVILIGLHWVPEEVLKKANVTEKIRMTNGWGLSFL